MTGSDLDTVVRVARFARAMDVLVHKPGAIDHLARETFAADGEKPHPLKLAEAIAHTMARYEDAQSAAIGMLRGAGAKTARVCREIEALGGIEHLERCADAVRRGGLNVLAFPPRDPEDDGAA